MGTERMLSSKLVVPDRSGSFGSRLATSSGLNGDGVRYTAITTSVPRACWHIDYAADVTSPLDQQIVRRQVLGPSSSAGLAIENPCIPGVHFSVKIGACPRCSSLQ